MQVKFMFLYYTVYNLLSILMWATTISDSIMPCCLKKWCFIENFRLSLPFDNFESAEVLPQNVDIETSKCYC